MSFATDNLEVLALMLTESGETATVNGVSGTVVFTRMDQRPNGGEFDQTIRTGRLILSKAVFTLTLVEARNYGSMIDSDGNTWRMAEISGENNAWWQLHCELIEMSRTGTLRMKK